MLFPRIIDHSKNDADKRLLSALRAGNKTKKKAGRKREWTGNRQFDFFWDCVQAEILCKKKLHRRPKKKELAEEMVRLYRDKYGDADRIRTMLSGAHLRPVNQHVLRTKEFSVSALAPSREHMKAHSSTSSRSETSGTSRGSNNSSIRRSIKWRQRLRKRDGARSATISSTPPCASCFSRAIERGRQTKRSLSDKS